MDEFEWRIALAEMKKQRDDALSQSIHYAVELAKARRRINELEKQQSSEESPSCQD